MKYPISSRIIHWLMAALIIFLIGLGIYMSQFLSKEAPNRLDIYNLHKSLGALALGAVFIRIINRGIFKSPELPNSLPKIEKIGAKSSHFLLYILMIAVPLSGYLMSNSFGYPVNFFGHNLPNMIEPNEKLSHLFHELHEILPYVMLGVIALHIAGAVKHRFFDKAENDVLKRML